MKASDMVKELQDYIEKYGDADVKISYAPDCKYYLVSEIYYSIANNGFVIE